MHLVLHFAGFGSVEKTKLCSAAYSCHRVDHLLEGGDGGRERPVVVTVPDDSDVRVTDPASDFSLEYDQSQVDRLQLRLVHLQEHLRVQCQVEYLRHVCADGEDLVVLLEEVIDGFESCPHALGGATPTLIGKL